MFWVLLTTITVCVVIIMLTNLYRAFVDTATLAVVCEQVKKNGEIINDNN